MKKTYFLPILLLLFCFTNCNDNSEDEIAPLPKPVMKAKTDINNLKFESLENEVIISEIVEGVWQLSGVNAQNDILAITMPKSIAVGTYPNSSNGWNATFFKQGTETYVDEVPSELKITEKTDKYMKGTFYFRAQAPSQIIPNTYSNITEGEFTVHFLP